MRVGIDIRLADPGSPGQQRYLWRLGQWLGQRGHVVHMLTQRRQSPGVDPGTATLLELAGRSRADVRKAVADLELDVLLLNPERSRRYRGMQPNVLRSGYGTEHYAQKLRSFPAGPVRTVRLAERAMPWVLAECAWERAFYEGGEALVVAQSEYMKSEILQSYRVSEDRVHVIPNGVDPEQFNPFARLAVRAEARGRWSIPEESVCFLFLGHNFRLKGLWQLLEAVAKGALGSDGHLLVVGRGTGPVQRRKARFLVDRLGLSDRVTLAGPVSPSSDAIAAADALVHLSWHDSFGFAVLEAMASGLPVVTTRFVGAAELIRSGESGLIIDPGEPDDVAAAIGELLDADVRRAIGEGAAAAAAPYTELANFGRVEEVFRLAAERRSGPIA